MKNFYEEEVHSNQYNRMFILKCSMSFRCLPMNLTMEEIANQTAGATKDRMKIGSSLADVDPMSVDRSVSPSTSNYKEHHTNFLYFLQRVKYYG